MEQDKTEKKIVNLLDKVRPYIQMHGGDVEFVEVSGSVVTLRVSGACIGCPLADITYSKMIGELIRKEVPKVKKVVLM